MSFQSASLVTMQDPSLATWDVIDRDSYIHSFSQCFLPSCLHGRMTRQQNARLRRHSRCSASAMPAMYLVCAKILHREPKQRQWHVSYIVTLRGVIFWRASVQPVQIYHILSYFCLFYLPWHETCNKKERQWEGQQESNEEGRQGGEKREGKSFKEEARE